MTEDVTKILQEQFDAACEELANLEIELAEIKVKQTDCKERVDRLRAAVAALEGKDIPRSVGGAEADSKPSDEGSTPSRPAKQQEEAKPKAKPNPPDDPLAHQECKGCGSTGTLYQTYHTASSGMIVNMLKCSDCRNEMIMGM